MSRQGWKILDKVQRRAALRVTSAYRTVYSDALFIVASIPPIQLQAKKSKHIYDNRTETDRETTGKIACREMLAAWQEKWRQAQKGGELTNL